MITIRIPIGTIMVWFIPIFLILMGIAILLNGIATDDIVFCISGPLFIIAGITCGLSNLGIVRFKTE